MFEKIVLRRAPNGTVLTLGDLAEAMLFYQSVHIILDFGAFNSLIDALTMRGLLNLLDRKNVTAVYTDELLATHTNTVEGRNVHSFLAVIISGDKETGPIKGRQKRLEYLLYSKKGHSRKEARTLAERFLKKVPLKKFGSDYFVQGGILKAATADILQPEYAAKAIREILRGTPGLEPYVDSARFDVLPRAGGFEVWTNVDFEAASARRKALNSGLDVITEAHLAGAFLDASSDTILAAHYGADFYTSTLSSELVRLQHAELLKRAGISATELTQFKDVAIPEYPSIREIINGGFRTFDEFLTLLDKAQKFREWIQGQNPDAKVAHEYIRSITAEGWASTVPAKLMRFVMSTAIGLVGLPQGLVASAADSFLLDRISKGWRPNHFIDGKLKPFLRSPD